MKQRRGKEKASTKEGERERDKEKLEYYTNVYQFNEAEELTIMLGTCE